VAAVNLDGGSSSVMAVQYPGNGFTTIVNSPSSGKEILTANALHVVSSLPALQAPSTVPTALTAVAESNFVIRLSWQPSITATPTTMYRVFRNGRAIGKKQSGLEFIDKRPKAKWLTYRVRAIYADGSKSALSPPIRIKSRLIPPQPPPE
jgi:hypothetical protein